MTRAVQGIGQGCSWKTMASAGLNRAVPVICWDDQLGSGHRAGLFLEDHGIGGAEPCGSGHLPG
jgi:hypothetical protein